MSKKNPNQIITKKINWEIINKVLNLLVFLLVFSLASVVIVSSLNLKSGIKIFSVKSGSMYPSLPAGSLVVIKPANDYQIGDVITYARATNPNPNNLILTTTHRIIEIEKEGEETFYISKGDYNYSSDGESVNKNQVLGKVIWALPYLGYLSSFVRTEIGFIVLIVIPATLIIYNEVLNLKKQLSEILRERKYKYA